MMINKAPMMNRIMSEGSKWTRVKFNSKTIKVIGRTAYKTSTNFETKTFNFYSFLSIFN